MKAHMRRKLQRLAHEVVIERVGYSDIYKIARRKLLFRCEEDRVVDFRRVISASSVVTSVIISSVNNDFKCLSDFFAVFLKRYFRLHEHYAVPALFLYILPDVSFHFVGGCSFFAGISENTESFKSYFMHKIIELFKIFFSFARETGYKRGSYVNIGQFFAELGYC